MNTVPSDWKGNLRPCALVGWVRIRKYITDACDGDKMAHHQLVVVVKGYLAGSLDVKNGRNFFSYRVDNFSG